MKAAKRPYGLFWWGFLLVAWSFVVSSPFDRYIRRADQLGCVGPHLTQLLLLMTLGMLSGAAMGGAIRSGAQVAGRAVFPNWSERARQRALQGFAVLLIVANMVLVFPWLNLKLDQFVASHDGLKAEIDLVLFLMGGLSGGAWAVLWRHRASVGIVISLAMLLMMLANTLTRHAWC